MSDSECARKKQKFAVQNCSKYQSKAGDTQKLPSPQKPSIFQLTVDCFDEIFDYLSLSDLHSIGQTCKTMQNVAGEYFKQNFSAAETICQEDGIYMRYSDNVAADQRIKIDGFHKFITKITHRSVSIEPLKYIEEHCDEFMSVTHITLPSIERDHVNYIKRMLPKIEVISIVRGWIEIDLYESLLKWCKKLKSIHLRLVREISVPGHHSWMMQKYPKLQHLELIPVDSMDLLEAFFEKNQHVRSFCMSLLCIYVFKDDFMASNIQLDTFEVEYFSVDEHFGLESVYDVINKLYERGFYKRLQFHMNSVNQQTSEQLITLKRLERLCIRNFTHAYSLIGLVQLKELAILNGANPVDMDILANSIMTIERLYVKRVTIDDILPFIRHSPNLTKIKVFPKDDTSFNNGVLDMMMLNRERGKLLGARKTLIFVPDNIFLTTKWTTKDGDTNLHLVEIKRADSYEWNYEDF